MNPRRTVPEGASRTPAELFDAVKAGYQALGELLQGHRDYLRTILQAEMGEHLRARADASDIIQEAQLDVLEHVTRETRGLFAVKQEEDLRAWLRRVCLNALLNHSRDQGRDKRDAGKDRPLPEGLPVPASGPTASGLACRRERHEALERALNRLGDPDRLLLRLRYWHQFSYAQLAELVEGQATEAGRVRMQRRMAELELRLGEDGELRELGDGAP